MKINVLDLNKASWLCIIKQIGLSGSKLVDKGLDTYKNVNKLGLHQKGPYDVTL